MKHWTCVCTDGSRDILAVVAVTELGDGQLNIAVASRAGAKCEPGKWIVATAQDRAVKWAEGLVGRKLVPSRWAEVGITP